MKKFNTVDKVFVKSNNTINKIYFRYFLSLIILFIFLLISNYMNKDIYLIKRLIITFSIDSVLGVILQYILNLLRNKKKYKLVFTEDYIINISLILSMITYKDSYYISLLVMFISMIPKLFNKDNNMISCLYGILFFLGYKYFYLHDISPLMRLNDISISHSELNTYGPIWKSLTGVNCCYISNILCIIILLFLFFKKSIKYSLVFNYLFTFIIMILIYSLLNGFNIYYIISEIFMSNIMFYTVFCGGDYRVTPISNEGQKIYGIILAILTFILRFILPELDIVLVFIIGSLFLTRVIDKFSYKLKYNKKFYHFMLIVSYILVIITILIKKIVF